jgi:hypothetical protein
LVKHTEKTVEFVQHAPESGIYRMYDNGYIAFSRFDTHRRSVESDAEAFYLRITGEGDYLYEGCDMGILVMRGRLMNDDAKLTTRAEQWIAQIRTKYAASMVSDNRSSGHTIRSLLSAPITSSLAALPPLEEEEAAAVVSVVLEPKILPPSEPLMGSLFK